MARRFGIFWCMFLYLLTAGYSLADNDHILSAGYWVDESGIATLGDAKQADLTGFSGSIAKGYSRDALWIRLRIAGRDDGERLAIVIKPAFVQRIELYDPVLAGPHAPPVVSGRDAPIGETNFIGLDSGFVIPSSPGQRDVYLRITTTTSLTADISVVPAAVARGNSFMLGGAVAVYFAFLLAFCLWGLVAWVVRRDALYGLFALRQLYSVAHAFNFFGALRFFLSGSLDAEARDLIYLVIGCTVASVAGYFDVRLISEYGGARWLRRVVYLLLCMPVVTLTCVALDQTQTALQLSSLFVKLQFFALLAFAFTTRADETKSLDRTAVWLVRIGYAIMTAVVVAPLLMFQNLLQTSVPLFNILFLHAVISTIILFAILSIRSRQRDLVAQETRLMVEIKEAELRKESSRRVEKERFLSMLTHELRNPLSVIRLLDARKASDVALVQRAARDMANVIDRVEQSERIDDHQIHVEKTVFDLAALVRQIVQDHSVHDRVVLDDTLTQPVLSDAALIQRVVENLLDNAAKYSVRGSEIRIALGAQAVDGAEGVLLQITNLVGDAGAPDPERLFSKYYRSKRAHRQPGSGLGLFLVASWVSALGGAPSYTPGTAPSGAPEATFSIWLPQ